METELQQAESIARHVMKNQFAFVADVVAVCRVFLAQQARLAEVQEGAAEMLRQRDHYRAMWQAAESRLASARVEGAREGFEQAGQWLFSTYFYAKAASVEWMGMEKFRLEAARRYPAPAAPAGEQTRPAPTEREAEQPSVFRTPAAFSSSIFVTEACADCEALNGNEWSVAGRVYCPKHSITLRPTPPQAAPEPGVIVPSRIWLPVKDGKVCINPRDAANFALMADAHAEASHDASGRGE